VTVSTLATRRDEAQRRRIERLWLHIIAYRLWRHNQRSHQLRNLEDYVALEIKGLKSNMLKVAQRIERLNTKAAAFDEIGGSLEQGLDDITAQAKAHHEDLAFAATVLGNSTTASGEAEQPKEPPAEVVGLNQPRTQTEPPQTHPAAFGVQLIRS
jgi:hypothetical protein